MDDNNDEKENPIKNMKRFILNIIFLVTLLINTLSDIIVRKRIRYFIGFCVINLAPILILINATFNSDNDNIKYILINNNKNDGLNYQKYQKKFILVSSILKIIIEVIFIIIAIIICNINYEEPEKYETEKSGETGETQKPDTNSKKSNRLLDIICKYHEENPENIYIAYKLFNFSLYLSLYFILIMDGILSLFGFEFINLKDIGLLVIFTFCLVIPFFPILILSIKTIKQYKKKDERDFKNLKHLLIVDISLVIQMGYCIALLIYIGLKYKNYRNYCNIITIPIITMISSLLSIITSILFYLKSKNAKEDDINEFFILYLKYEYNLHSDEEYDHENENEEKDKNEKDKDEEKDKIIISICGKSIESR
ncbi:hypothetical protein C1646_750969 [Rhizophagus diaphanus]|nr:hypothetical protein C1646_750969 [Rhizophagus diaphanus] [Rhizophagus sp. MUCL 43196]